MSNTDNGNTPAENKRLLKYKRFLIVDSEGRLMAWSATSKQICYVNNETWEDPYFAAKSYSLKTARKHIETTVKNRKRWKMEPGVYYVVPFIRS